MSTKVTYKSISGFEFQTAMQKLMNAPTDGLTAYKVKKMNAELKKLRAIIADSYRKEVVEVYAQRDAEGKYDEHTFQPEETKREEFEKVQASFGDKEATIDRPKLTLQDVRDAKLSPAEQEALDPILDDSEGDAIPVRNVSRIK